MDDTKNPFASMGVWGSIAAVILAIAPAVAPLLHMTPTELGLELDHIGTGIAGVIALVGRLRATHILKF